MILPKSNTRPKTLSVWLTVVALLVFCIIVVGGITRLTESGLSITEWKPVSGVIPPLNDADWAAEFEKYRQIPEYQLINKGMSLADFKTIYFWEWIHRQLGRLIGVSLALPFAWFALRRAIPKGYTLRLFALVMLVGLQGAIGWWMVSSGLELRTDVSHIRLSVHLLTALFLFSGLIWTIRDLRALARDPSARPARLTGLGLGVGVILFIQLLFGAWVAGMNAGTVTTHWPMMDDAGTFFPAAQIGWNEGVVSAVVNDPFLLNFIHRWWAWVALIALIILARRLKAIGARAPSIAIHSVVGTQIILGIATVMTGVNITLAVMHQAVGALLVAATAWGVHRLGQFQK
jgi:heme a synthase